MTTAKRTFFFDRYSWTFVLAVVLTAGCHSESGAPQSAPATSNSPSDSQSKPDFGGLKVQFAGQSWETAPKVMILLHGYGASGSDLVPLSRIFDHHKKTAYIFPQAPIPIGKDSYAWSNRSDAEFEQSRAMVVALIEQVRAANPDCQITVGGFSQGATIACNLLSEGDPPIANVLLFSPNPRLYREPSTTGTHPNVHISHGRNDEMIPFADVEKLKNDLESKG